MAGKPLQEWRSSLADSAALAASSQGWVVTDGPVMVSVRFRMRMPRRPKFSVPVSRPDIDKLCRAVLDAIGDSGAVWKDDSQVVTLIAAKEYGEPGVIISVTAKP
jgi:Holliday junction resolvase RusA-like endonuclease